MPMRTFLAALILACPLAAQPVQSPPGGHTPATLEEALKKLGYEVQKVANTEAVQISTTRDGTTLYTRVSLSGDRTNIWLNTVVLTLPNAASRSSEAMRRLLQENETIGPTRFTYHESDESLRVQKHVGNRAMTPVKLRKAIDDFDAEVRKLEPLWRRDNFVRVMSVPADAVAAAMRDLDGEWTIVEMWNLGTKLPDDQIQKSNLKMRFASGKLSTVNAGKVVEADIAVDPRGDSKKLDVIEKGRVSPGIYKLDGNTLTLVMTSTAGEERPTSFEPKAGEKLIKIVLKRGAKP